MVRVIQRWEGKTVFIVKSISKKGVLYYFRGRTRKGVYIKGSKKRIPQKKARYSIRGIRGRREKKPPYVKVTPVVKERLIPVKKPLKKGLWWLGVPSDGFNTIAVGVFPMNWTDEQIQRWVYRMSEFAHIFFVSEYIYPYRPTASHYYTPYGKRRG